MVQPVDRNELGAQLASFQPFQVDTGRSQRALAASNVGRSVAGAAIRVNEWAGYVAEEEKQRVKQAEATKAMKDIFELESNMGPVVDSITKDTDLSPAEKRKAFEEAFADASETYKYADPEISAKAEVGRGRLKMQWGKGLDLAIVKEERAKTEANVHAGLRALSQQSVHDPELAIVRAEALIATGGQAAGWDASKIEEETAKWTGAMAANHIKRQLADPSKVEELYASLLDETQHTTLDPASRTALTNMAATQVERVQRDKIAAAERADRLAEKAVKENQASNAAQLRVGIMNLEVTESQLTSALQQRKISLQAFNQLLPALRNEGEQTDHPDTVVNLTRDIYAGRADERNVWNAYGDGRLSKSTADTLFAKVESVQKSGGPLARDDVKRGREYVDQMVGGIRGPLAILDSQASQRVAEAMRDYDERIEAEAEAASAENRRPEFEPIRDEIVRLYKPDTSASLSALRRPRYAPDVPREQIDIDAVRRATAEALQRRDIDEQEAAEEARLLQDYAAILNRPKPAMPEKRR